jgi:CHAT domain-containing protein
LRVALFDKLATALAGRRRLLIAAEGELTQIPFEILPTEDGGYLLDQYTFSYLDTGRDVLRFGAAAGGAPTEPVVAAYTEFAADPNLACGDPSPSPSLEGFWRRWSDRLWSAWKHSVPQEHPQTTHAALRTGAATAGDLSPGNSSVESLTGVRGEVEHIADLLGVEPLADASALTSQFSLRRSPRILHLAAPSFCTMTAPDELTRGPRPSAEDAPHRLTERAQENPLLRSGLTLAGTLPDRKQGRHLGTTADKLLSARDVSKLNLSSTDLVVLSTYETGSAASRPAESILGLRRAFLLAGAKTLVVSLWRMPDPQRQELLKDFYQRIQAGTPCAEALRESKLALRTRYPDPRCWGAFVCAGDAGSSVRA